MCKNNHFTLKTGFFGLKGVDIDSQKFWAKTGFSRKNAAVNSIQYKLKKKLQKTIHEIAKTTVHHIKNKNKHYKNQIEKKHALPIYTYSASENELFNRSSIAS